MDNLDIIALWFQDNIRPLGSSLVNEFIPNNAEERCDCCYNIPKNDPNKSWEQSPMWLHCRSIPHLKNKILQKILTHCPDSQNIWIENWIEKLTESIEEAMKMTKETAPLYLDTKKELLIYVRDYLLGVYQNVVVLETTPTNLRYRSLSMIFRTQIYENI
jgi:hypothetical protein